MSPLGSASLRRLAALALAAGLSASPAVAADAQPAIPNATALGAVVVTEGATDGVLRRLPSLGRETKLSGESDRLSWPVWVTAAEATQAQRLRLTYTAAVSVMPEASHLAVTINDRTLGAWRLSTGGTARTLDVSLPAGSLRPGWNLVRLDAEQRHRVECSVSSTYELWTEIDRARSGLVFAAGYAPERRALADIAGVAPDEHGRIHIRLVMPQDPEPTQLRRALQTVQALTVAGGFLDPIVDVTRTLGKGPGIDLLVGPGPRALHESLPTLAAGTVALVDDPDPTRLVVALPDDQAALERLLTQLLDETGPKAPGTEAGLAARAALGGLAVEGGARVRLNEVGVASGEFSGRLYRASAHLRLPADLYAADYAKVIVRLDGGYAPGLDSAARLTVRVNGRQTAGAPLTARGGEIFTDRSLQLPLSAFRPGHNHLEIEAAVPHPDDRTCDVGAQIEGPKRFLLTEATEIRFPTFARIARLPDLAATAAGVLSDLDDARRPSLYVPHPDTATLSAAATFLARVAAAGERIDVPPIVFRNPPSDAPSALVFGAFADLPVTIAAAVGIEPMAIRDAWGRRQTAPQVSEVSPAPTDRVARRLSALRAVGDVDPIMTGSVPVTTGSIGPRTFSVGRTDGETLDRWRRSMESPWSPSVFLRGLSSRTEQMFSDVTGRGREPIRFSPRPSTGLVVAQALSSAGGVWTLVTAPSAGTLGEGIAALTESGRWNDIEGSLAAWDQVDERTQITGSIRHGYFATRDLDPRNLRLIAGAWVSDNPIGFILGVLFATGLLGFATARLLPHLGGEA